MTNSDFIGFSFYSETLRLRLEAGGWFLDHLRFERSWHVPLMVDPFFLDSPLLKGRIRFGIDDGENRAGVRLEGLELGFQLGDLFRHLLGEVGLLAGVL